MSGGAVAFAVFLLAALVLGVRAGTPPATAEGAEAQTVRVASAGSHPELVRTVPIARRLTSKPRVVMSLGPGKLRTLRSGDRVEGRAEVEVSTTCLVRMPKCIGSKYRFSPRVAARLVLARRANQAKGPRTMPLSGWRRIACSQRLPARNHHCVLVIPSAGRLLRDASRAPCRDCHLNLVVSAHHPHAKRGQRLVIGADSPGGVSQNKGELAAAVYRPHETKALGEAAARRRPRLTRLPIGPERRGAARRRVVYSVRLDDLRAGETLIADARMVGKIKHLRYNALVQARLILGTTPDTKRRTWIPAQVGAHGGRIGPQNGFNCTQGQSAHRDPCRVRKTGVMRIVRDAREDPIRGEGARIPLYLNLVVGVRAAGVHSDRRRARHRMRVRERPGFVRVRRYAPRFAR